MVIESGHYSCGNVVLPAIRCGSFLLNYLQIFQSAGPQVGPDTVIVGSSYIVLLNGAVLAGVVILGIMLRPQATKSCKSPPILAADHIMPDGKSRLGSALGKLFGLSLISRRSFSQAVKENSTNKTEAKNLYLFILIFYTLKGNS
jgi:hypothetical protein